MAPSLVRIQSGAWPRGWFSHFALEPVGTSLVWVSRFGKAFWDELLVWVHGPCLVSFRRAPQAAGDKRGHPPMTPTHVRIQLGAWPRDWFCHFALEPVGTSWVGWSRFGKAFGMSTCGEPGGGGLMERV